MGARQLDAVPGQLDRRLAEAPPRQAPEPPPELLEPRRQSRNAARGDADGIGDGLLPEWDLEPGGRSRCPGEPEPGDGHEAVEELRPAGGRVPPDRVAAAGYSRHDRLGDARGKRRRDRRIGSRAALDEDLEPRPRGRGVTGRDAGSRRPGAHGGRTLVDAHRPSGALLAFSR